ncbi:MAG: hypothetical protein ACLUVC_00820 [Longibaculum sp.]
MKNMVIKYTLLFIGLLMISVFIHYGTIFPLIGMICESAVCRNFLNTLTLMIGEPVICIIIIVYFINHKEKQYYDSIS